MLQWDANQPFTHGVYSLENEDLTAHKSSMPGRNSWLLAVSIISSQYCTIGTIYILRTKTKLEGSGAFYWEVQIDQTSGNQELHIGIAEEHYKYECCSFFMDT